MFPKEKQAPLITGFRQRREIHNLALRANGALLCNNTWSSSFRTHSPSSQRYCARLSHPSQHLIVYMPEQMGTFVVFSPRVTRLESAESTWRHVKYSLLSRRGAVFTKPDVSHCFDGIPSPKDLIPAHGLAVQSWACWL